MSDAQFTHLDADGGASMVDVSAKAVTKRKAVAGCTVELSSATMQLLVDKALPKGDVLTTAKIAGIQGAKRTSELIPLCHPLSLSHADVSFEVDQAGAKIHIRAEAVVADRTGIEMEALVAAQVAALTIYDMCKAVQKDIRITDCRLIHKSGGRSGDYNAT